MGIHSIIWLVNNNQFNKEECNRDCGFITVNASIDIHFISIILCHLFIKNIHFIIGKMDFVEMRVGKSSVRLQLASENKCNLSFWSSNYSKWLEKYHLNS